MVVLTVNLEDIHRVKIDFSVSWWPDDGRVQEELQRGVWEADAEKPAVPETTGAVRLSEDA